MLAPGGTWWTVVFVIVVVLLYTSSSVNADNDQVKQLLVNVSTIAVDKILDNYKSRAVKVGKETGSMKLKDMENITSRNFLALIKSNFQANDGHLRNILSVQRAGDVNVTLDRSVGITINATVAFDSLEADYDNFTLTLSLVGKSQGKIKVAIRDCRFHVSVRVAVIPRCNAQLNDLKIVEFGRLEPTVTGMRYKVVDSMAESLDSKFLAQLVVESKSKIVNYFEQNIYRAVRLTDVCSILVAGYLM